jgi:hypothetical protein
MTRLVLIIALAIFGIAAAQAAEPRTATLYKDPECGCCAQYADYLDSNGFAVQVVPTDDLAAIKAKFGVPDSLMGCHTLIVEGYVVEGHVPLAILRKLLADKPAIKGISLPGMPVGSPGMTGSKTEPFTVYEIDGETARIYAVE